MAKIIYLITEKEKELFEMLGTPVDELDFDVLPVLFIKHHGVNTFFDFFSIDKSKRKYEDMGRVSMTKINRFLHPYKLTIFSELDEALVNKYRFYRGKKHQNDDYGFC